MVYCLLAVLVVLVFVVALVSAPTLAVPSNTILANSLTSAQYYGDPNYYIQEFAYWWFSNHYCVSIGGSHLGGFNYWGFSFPIFLNIDGSIMHSGIFLSSGGLSMGGLNLGGGLSFTLPVGPWLGPILFWLIVLGCAGPPIGATITIFRG